MSEFELRVCEFVHLKTHVMQVRVVPLVLYEGKE